MRWGLRKSITILLAPIIREDKIGKNIPIILKYYRDKKGVASVLVPGGALEALNADPNQIRLVLNRRKGFIKLALRFGSDLVPTFSFGETFIYDQVQTYGNYFNLHKINFN